MQRSQRVLVIAGISALCTTTVDGASTEDGKAAFERREDTMKRMGRPLYLGIGRVVKGTVAYGPETVVAAETVAALASTLDRRLFPPGSDVAESRIKPEVFTRADLLADRQEIRRLRAILKIGSPTPVRRVTRNFARRSVVGASAAAEPSGVCIG